MNPTTTILLSKKKLVLGLTGSLLFVLLGFYIISFRAVTGIPIFDSLVTKYIAGGAAIVVFGFFAILYVIKLTDAKAGIVIDDKGFTDNSSSVSLGAVSWADVTNISVVQLAGQSFLIVKVANPQHYIDQQTNALMRMNMKFNYKKYGSPLAIAATGLQCNIAELSTVLTGYLQNYKGQLTGNAQ